MRFRFYVLRRRQGRLTRVLTKHFGSLMGYLGRVLGWALCGELLGMI